MADKPEFTLEDILAEERARRDGVPAQEEAPAPAEGPAPAEEGPSIVKAPAPIELPRQEKAAIQTEAVPTEEPAPPEAPGKKKKKKRSLFGRRKKMPDFDEGEDMYYGIQLKPLDEYRLDNDVPEDLAPGGDSFKALFDDSTTAIDQEVEENFQRLQQERYLLWGTTAMPPWKSSSMSLTAP